jgi:hypothetical protein
MNWAAATTMQYHYYRQDSASQRTVEGGRKVSRLSNTPAFNYHGQNAPNGAIKRIKTTLEPCLPCTYLKGRVEMVSTELA